MLLRNIVDRLDKSVDSYDESICWLITIPLVVLVFAAIFGFMVSLGTYDRTTETMVGSTPYPLGYVMLAATVFTLGFYGFATALFGRHKYWLVPLSMQLALYGGIYGLSLLTGLSWIVYVIFAIATVAVAELIYWADPQKPEASDSHYWFAAKVKLECYMDVGFGWLVAGSVLGFGYAIVVNGKAFVDNATQALLTYGIYPLAVIGAIVAIWGYIYLNSLKFRKIPKEEPKVEESKKEDDTEERKPAVFTDCSNCGKLNNASLRTNCYYCSAPLPKEKKEVES